jgi:hypothetical protein
MMKTMAITGLALVAGFGAVTALEGTAERANAQADFNVTAEQLRINQRIAQAGVRRSNEALARLDALEAKPGTPGPQGAPGPQGPPGPAGALPLRFYAEVQRPPRLGDPMPIYPPGYVEPEPRGVGLVRFQWPQEGVAWVTFNGPVAACVPSATLYSLEDGEISASTFSTGALPSPGTVEVRTRASDGTPASRSFNLLVFCPPS